MKKPQEPVFIEHIYAAFIEKSNSKIDKMRRDHDISIKPKINAIYESLGLPFDTDVSVSITDHFLSCIDDYAQNFHHKLTEHDASDDKESLYLSTLLSLCALCNELEGSISGFRYVTKLLTNLTIDQIESLYKQCKTAESQICGIELLQAIELIFLYETGQHEIRISGPDDFLSPDNRTLIQWNRDKIWAKRYEIISDDGITPGRPTSKLDKSINEVDPVPNTDAEKKIQKLFGEGANEKDITNYVGPKHRGKDDPEVLSQNKRFPEIAINVDRITKKEADLEGEIGSVTIVDDKGFLTFGQGFIASGFPMLFGTFMDSNGVELFSKIFNSVGISIKSNGEISFLCLRSDFFVKKYSGKYKEFNEPADLEILQYTSKIDNTTRKPKYSMKQKEDILHNLRLSKNIVLFFVGLGKMRDIKAAIGNNSSNPLILPMIDGKLAGPLPIVTRNNYDYHKALVECQFTWFLKLNSFYQILNKHPDLFKKWQSSLPDSRLEQIIPCLIHMSHWQPVTASLNNGSSLYIKQFPYSSLSECEDDDERNKRVEDFLTVASRNTKDYFIDSVEPQKLIHNIISAITPTLVQFGPTTQSPKFLLLGDRSNPAGIDGHILSTNKPTHLLLWGNSFFGNLLNKEKNAIAKKIISMRLVDYKVVPAKFTSSHRPALI
ncbi:hypothetical protein B9Z52_16865 [Limnohabitans sp. Jir72]|nr:hypothetical protein B9Z52_16865 [Limnohabitans sp. Jir72]